MTEALVNASLVNYWPLIGVAAVVLGFVLRLNPALVVVSAGFITGLAAKLSPLEVLDILGKAFTEKRFLLLFLATLPVIGLLERFGLQQQARALISRMRGATTGRVLILYLGFRQVFAALGLTSVAGQAQTVRPLVAPMALAAAEKEHGELDEATAEHVAAMSAATDNVGLFFGEDIFIAISSILLIQGALKTYGIELTPFELSMWALPSAICAFLIQATRLLLLDRRLRRAAR